MHTLKPLDNEAVLTAARETKAIVTLEEHGAVGGLGSAVSEALAQTEECKSRFMKLSIEDPFCKIVGAHKYLQEVHGLSVEAVYERIKSLLSSAST